MTSSGVGEYSQVVAAWRTSVAGPATSDRQENGVTHGRLLKRFVFYRAGMCIPAGLLGLYQGLRKTVRGRMDYVIAGIASLLLFGYLVYALLRPEKF
jgi:K+-transporting ATPase KdpF subunit